MITKRAGVEGPYNVEVQPTALLYGLFALKSTEDDEPGR
jgi:hypothetical protein